MMNNLTLLSIVAGFLFGFWPVIAKYSALTFEWLTFAIAFSTMVISTAMVIAKSSLPAPKDFLIGMVSGLMNGTGLVLYGIVLASVAGDKSKYVAIAGIMIPLAAVVGYWALWKEAVTIKKAAGLLLGCLAIYLLSSK